MKEFVSKLREKADIFAKSGCASDGIVKDYKEAADMIEGLSKKLASAKTNSNGMKEFVEKLIERLEEKSFIMQCADNKFHSFINIDKIKNTINQLAEEFDSDINVGSKNQDSTKNNQGWIPCSERLPVTDNESEFYSTVVVTNKYGEVNFAFYDGEEWFVFNEYTTEWDKDKNIIAWQPLPEPYKPEQQKEIPTEHFIERFNRVM